MLEGVAVVQVKKERVQEDVIRRRFQWIYFVA